MDLPSEVDVDGLFDNNYNRETESGTCIKYFGKATLQTNGKYRVLASVNRLLCIVEVNITFK